MLVLIMAGGTGGHIYPALAVAQQLFKLKHKVAWLGSNNGMETKIVPANKIPFECITISGLRGKGILSWLLAPYKLLAAVISAIKIIRKLNPSLVLGMGGFVSGPGALATKLLKIPLIIHEQNAIAGLTNKLLRPLANLTLQAFPNTLKNATTVGNPVRSEIKIGHAQSKLLNILVVGGSLGAQIFNDLMPEVYAKLAPQINIWHQTGTNKLDSTIKKYQLFNTKFSNNQSIKVVDFIDDMASALTWASLVIGRAGAMTIFELAAAGKPSILVPYPFAVDSHQTANAQYLSQNNAAVLLHQNNLTAAIIIKQLQLFLTQPELINIMAKKARAQHIAQATEKVAQFCLQLALKDKL